MIRRLGAGPLGAGPLGALALGGLAVVLLLLARWQDAPQAQNVAFALVAVVSASLLGYLLGINARSLAHQPGRDGLVALLAALVGIVVVVVWGRLATFFSAQEWQWLARPTEGFLALPALLPVAFVRRGGAVLLGLAVAGVVLVTVSSGLVYSPVQFLLVAIIALPAELFLQLRRQDAGLGTLAAAGALVAVMGTLVTAATGPDLLRPGGVWRLTGATLASALGGALAGAVAAEAGRRLRPRLGLGADGGWE